MPSAAATAILEFGKLIHTEASRPVAEHDPKRILTAERRLIEQLSVDDNPLLKPALLFHVSRPIEPLVVRVLALVAYLQLCTNFRVAITDVAIAATEDDTARIITARQVITSLLYTKRLQLAVNTDDQLELGQAMSSLLAGGSTKLPVIVNACELHRQWRRNEAEAAKRKLQESKPELPTARAIYESLSRFVIGQHDLKMALAVAGRQTLLRRAVRQRKQPQVLPPKPNVCVIGASGSGKSLACQALSQILHLPHASVDCSQVTASGYVGDDLSGCLSLLAQSAEAMRVNPEEGGLVHLDEIDKVSSAAYSSPTTIGVQFEALRLLDGAQVSHPVGNMTKWGGFGATMDTSNLLVVCSGAFSWLADDLNGRKRELGFAHSVNDNATHGGNLRELLSTRGGLIPEVVNRFSAIVRMEPLTPEDIAAILMSDRGALGEYRALLQAEGRTIAVEPEAALLVGQWSIATGQMGRGPKAALELSLREALFEGQPKDIVVTIDLVRQKLGAVGD
ncbi:MAG: ATP-dependent Clp protease ATP-binding subunit ClpX [Verrucomicrobiae bacterium]|nr:ATP-dependent Clp protease ATP-binding subunit ClpX [Verrucomicrobiae bacterium]